MLSEHQGHWPRMVFEFASEVQDKSSECISQLVHDYKTEAARENEPMAHLVLTCALLD
jgi:hypothetical protein